MLTNNKRRTEMEEMCFFRKVAGYIMMDHKLNENMWE
jgi:hypothetical protein